MTAPIAAPVVSVRALVRRFTVKGVLNGLDLDIRRGEFVALLGPSGSGKSTLLRAIAGLDREATGSGEIHAPERLAVVFQDARLLPWKRVLQNVMLGLEGPDAEARARLALDEVELLGREAAWPSELSGGQQQRVALARAVAREPELLLADEPFGALDALTRLRMHALMRRLAERHRPAVLLVTHDVDEAIALADRVVVLQDGRLFSDIPLTLPPEERGGGPRHAALRAELLALLGVEAQWRDGDPAPARRQRPDRAPAPAGALASTTQE